MSAIQNFRRFKPAGPVASAFLADREHDVRALLGPVGGGKSVSCVFDCIRNASLMPPCNDDQIRFRIAIIGETYGQLERNLYPTWTTWLPRDGGNWTEGEWIGGGGRFATHKLEWEILRGNRLVPVLFEGIFAAIGDNSVEEFMRGFEPTAFWLYEMDLLPEAVLDQAMFRIGRYPASGDDPTRPDAIPAGVDFRSYVIGDLNAPDTDSWFYRRFEEDVPAGHKVFKQPSGRSPNAENIVNLPRGYYDRQVKVLSAKRGGKHLVKRMVDAKYAPSLNGVPVYEDEYDDAVHLAPQPIVPLPGVPMTMGFDQGLRRPAMVLIQPGLQGQYRVLAECMPGRMNARRFADQVRKVLEEVAPGVPLAEVHYCDPAGFDGADTEAGDTAWAETLASELDIVILPTDTNEVDPRLTAVSDELTYRIEPQVPGLIISPICKVLRKGFASDYRYKRERVGNTEHTSDKPDKRMDCANLHDALQYGLLGMKGRYAVIEGRERPQTWRQAIREQNPDPRGASQRRNNGDCVVIKAPVAY